MDKIPRNWFYLRFGLACSIVSMYHEFPEVALLDHRGFRMGRIMRKLLLVALTVLLLSGCSFHNVWKWLDQADWERDDQTIRVVDFLLR